MPRQRIEKLGSVGLNTDVQPYMLPPQAWTRLLNVQTSDGSIRTVNGERKLFDLQIRPLYHTAYVGFNGQQYLIVSDGLAVHAHDIYGGLTDITPSGGLNGGIVSFTDLNGILVMNSRSDGAFYWDFGVTPPDNILKPLPGWDTNWRCRDMRAYRYNLVAMGMTESNTYYPHKVRWSSSAAEGEIPTEWVASNANDAGADLIGETEGEITGARLVRDSLWIVKEDAVYDMHWIGGEYVMQLSRLKGAAVGTRLTNGFAEMKGGLALFTTADVLIFDGQQSVSLADQRVRTGIFQAVSEELWDFSQVFVHNESSSLIIAGVESGYRQLSGALIFNWEENTWSQRRLHFSYGFDSAFVTTSSGLLSWDELGPAPFAGDGPEPMWLPGRPWDDQTDGSWNKGVYQPSVRDVVVYESNDDDTAWWVSLIGLVNTNWDGSPKTCTAERIGIPIEGCDGLAMVTQVWPEITGNIPVTITVGGMAAPGANPEWGEPIVFTPGVDFTVTPRITGRFICLRVESSENGSWAFGSVTLDWQRAGER